MDIQADNQTARSIQPGEFIGRACHNNYARHKQYANHQSLGEHAHRNDCVTSCQPISEEACSRTDTWIVPNLHTTKKWLCLIKVSWSVTHIWLPLYPWLQISTAKQAGGGVRPPSLSLDYKFIYYIPLMPLLSALLCSLIFTHPKYIAPLLTWPSKDILGKPHCQACPSQFIEFCNSQLSQSQIRVNVNTWQPCHIHKRPDT